jgi:DNA-binding LacI/PurR family transcriptional regulator
MKDQRRQRSKRATAEDVARHLGVSQSTISRAFTPAASVSDDMRRKVIEAAAQLGYQPNVIARSLITRRTNMVAIVIGNLVDPFYTTLLDTLMQHLRASGKQTLLLSPGPGEHVDAVLPALLQYQVDGIIITSATLSSEMAQICAQRETPVVLLNRYVPGVDIQAVSCDNVLGGRQIAEHLVALGHQRFAFVAGQPDSSTSLDRQQGFVSTLAQLGFPSCAIEQGGEYSYEAGRTAAQRLLQREPPHAVFFASDIMAFGGMDAFREAGMEVPGDISVAGFNDVPAATWPAYSLTTIRHPLETMAQMVLRRLGLAPKEEPSCVGSTTLIRGELVIRSSTGPRRAPDKESVQLVA